MRRLPAARSRHFRRSPLARAVAAGFLIAGGPMLWPAHAAGTLPTGLQVVAGQASATTQGALLTVKNSAGAILNWQSFNIGAANAVWFEQASATSKVLNRVVGNDPSLILGRLGSNGQVWLLNPNGVLFGAGARVDVAGLVASTLRLNDNDFLAGRYAFGAAAGDAGRVRNEGTLTTSFGGQVVLLGARVENAGEITAPGGAVSLAAATQVELVDTGLPNLAVRVDKAAGEALNLGRLVADGGRVDVYGAIVNQQGWVQADTLGTDATGQLTLRASETLTLGDASTTRAVGTAAGATGGAIDLLGAQVALTGTALADASGDAGGGRIRVGGGLRGLDAGVPNARSVWFGREATLRADATGATGAGGRITVWSDAATRAYGTLSARGGTAAGDGGFVETSGGWLDARPARVDVSSRGGAAGQWLLDPNDITINDFGPDTNVSGGPDFTSSNDGSVISTATLAAALNAGTSVTVSTGAAGSNGQAGDIVVDSAHLLVNPAAAVSLTLNAQRDVLVHDSVISSGAAALSLNLVSAGGGIGAIELRDVSITTAGGNMVLRGANAVQAPLPGGGFTPETHTLAIGYIAGQQPIVSKLSTPTIGVNLLRARMNLGSGSFTALGQGLDEAIRLEGTAADPAFVNARTVSLQGWATNASGVLVNNVADLVASERLELVGRGANGVSVDGGGRLTLNAPGNGAAVLSVDGIGTQLGVSIVDFSLLQAGGRGTPITASGGSVSITGLTSGNQPGIGIWSGGTLGDPLPAAATIDAAGATSLTLSGTAGSADGIGIARISVLGPANGSTLLEASGGALFAEQLNLVAGGTATFRAPYTDISFSNLLAGGNPLNLAFETSGAGSKGLYLLNSTVQTGGGDVRFGAVQNLNSAALGNTAAAAPWLVATVGQPDYTGTGIPAALWLEGSTVDAGSGRIHGGGAATAAAVDPMAGVTLETSVLTAREISLAGRSESESGMNVFMSTLTASRVLSLDALASTAGYVSLAVSSGNRLRLIDPTASAGSGLTLSGRHVGSSGVGVDLSGGDLGSNQETSIVADGGFLHIDGRIDNPARLASANAVSLSGRVAAPGGLLIDAAGATEVTLNAINGGDTGSALTARYMNFIGPQGSAASTFDITSRGGRTSVSAPTQITSSSFSSAGAITLLSDGLAIDNSRLVGDNGLALLTDTSSGAARAGAAVSVNNTELGTATAGAELRIAGNGGDAVRGTNGLNAGNGVQLTDSLIKSAGALVLLGHGADLGGAGIEITATSLQAGATTITGTGGAAGGIGVSLLDGTAISGSTVRLTGTGRGNAGVSLFASDTPGSVNAGTLLEITGRSGAGQPGVDLGQRFQLSAPQALVDSSVGITIPAAASPTSFDVSGTLTLRLATEGGATLGPRGQIDVDTLTQSLSPMPATATLAVDVTGGPLTVAGKLEVAPRVQLASDDSVLLSATAQLRSAATGDALRITAPTLNADPAATLDTPNGRWVLLLNDPATSSLGSLVPAFSAHDLGTQPWTTDAGGNLVTPAPGNALGWQQPLWPLGGGVRVKLAPKVYDTTTAVTADPDTWTIGGMLPGYTFTLAGDTTGQAPGKSTGIDIPVSFGGGTSFSLTDPNGLPVYGYGVPVFTVDVTPALATITGAAVAGKVYDGSTTATVTSRGTAEVLPGDVVGVGGVLTASFADKNVGAGKAVTVTGFELAGPDARNYTLVAPVGFTADITPAPMAVAGLTALNKVYDATTAATLAGVASITPLAGDAVTLAGVASGSFANKNVGTGKAVSIGGLSLAGADAGNYSLVLPAGLTADVTAAPLAVSGLTALNKTYDATANAPLAGAASIAPLAGDAVTLAGVAAGSFANKNVGAGKAVSVGGLSLAGADAGNYSLVLPAGLTADVTPAVATIAGAVVAGKVYDGTATATLSSLGTAQVLPGDVVGVGGVVTASFADKNVGAGKAVAVNGFALTGADAGNYTLQAPAGFTADITALPLAVAGLTALNKVYDATTAAPLAGAASIAPLAGDAVTLAGVASGSFASKNVGTGKAVSIGGLSLAGADAGNYSLVLPAGLTANVTAAPLAVSGLTALNKTYDASANAPLAGAASIAPLAGDAVTLSGAASGSFVNKNVGAGKAVTVAGLALAGADAGNYSLVLPAGLTADVTPAPLSLQGVVAAAKVYDGGTGASLAGNLGGLLAGDTVSLTLSGSFADRNVGNGRTVNWQALLGGADAGNYALAASTGSVQAAITPATLSYVATPATGTAGQALPTLTGTVNGLVGGETLAGATTGTLAWTTPATSASPAGAYAIQGSGLAALNYVFVQAAGNASALTLASPATSDPATTSTAVVFQTALVSVQIPVAMSTPTQGRVLDVTPALSSAPTATTAATTTPAPSGGTAVAASAGRSSEGGAPTTAPLPAGAGTAGPAAPGGSNPAALLGETLAAITASGNASSGGVSFDALDWSRLPRDEVQTLLAARARYKQQVFARGVFRLQQDPGLADVRACRNEAELATGECVITEQLKTAIQAERARLAAAAAATATAAAGPQPRLNTQRRVKNAALPAIERKLAVLIGVNDYRDAAVPALKGAIPDARAVRDLLEGRLGYETTVLENPSREAIVRALNKVALDAGPNDSVIVYYAGHGVLVPMDGVDTGFWLPADVDSGEPKTWLSNADIARLIAAVGAKQVMLVSDSCYSGTLAGRERVQVNASGDADELLKRRAAVIMSSGGEEPVADEGRQGHSVFAWHFMQALQGLDRWQVGGSLYERVRAAVVREFPQTPQYGASRSAGHQGNTDYLFERREFDTAAAAKP